MVLTSDTKAFLNSYSEIINEGEFKYLFESPYQSLRVDQEKQIYDECKNAKILPKNIEEPAIILETKNSNQ